MKLLFFCDTLNGGGTARVLVNLTAELIRRGHDITIALNEREVKYDIDSRIAILFAPQQEWYNGRNVLRRLLRNIVLSRHLRRHTRNAIHTVKPDIIITFQQCNLWHIIRSHGDVPIVHSEHNAYDRRLGFKRHYNRFILNHFFDRVCVLTSFDQGYAKAKGLKNTLVMPNPNSFVPITSQEYEQIFPQRKNIYMCARLNAWKIKGIDIAIEAFGKIAEMYPEVDMDVYGDGDDKVLNYLENLCVKYGVEKRVHFLGHCNNIISVIGKHQVFVLSSRTEGFPMVVTEAMTQGVPCVAYERLASSIITNGIDGVLVENGSVEHLAGTLQLMLNDPMLLKKMGDEAIKNVKRFSPQKIADRWEDMFLQLISLKGIKIKDR